MTMKPTSKKYLIVITGPTAVGKTAITLKLNAQFNTSIISADSRQVYKELAIGTAKPSLDEIKRGRIKLVDHVSVNEKYNVGQFEQDALSCIAEDFKNGQTSILSGGTGLYIKAVTEGLDNFPDVPENTTQELSKQLQENGADSLFNELKEKDPAYAEKVDSKNGLRIIRALSVIRHTGQPFSSFLGKNNTQRDFEVINIVLDREREELYNRINQRVDLMFEQGLVDEVKNLTAYRDHQALNTVGYKEVFKLIDGTFTLDQCKEEIKKNTRRYAKRQWTWLRKYNNGLRFHPSDSEEIEEHILKAMT